MNALRVARPDDGAALSAIYGPIVETSAISFELTPPSAAEMARRIEETLASYPWLVEEDVNGRIAGYAYASQHRARAAYGWSVDVTVYVDELCRGRGVGVRLYTALLEALRVQGFRSAFAGIALPNDASIALHESLGFTPVGVYRDVGFKLGAWRDVGWWQRPLHTDIAQPRTPTPFSDLDKSLLAPVTCA